MTPDQAVETIAKHILSKAADELGNDGSAFRDWSDYPEIGESDWDWVTCKLTELAPAPDAESFQRAYSLLTSRAEPGS